MPEAQDAAPLDLEVIVDRRRARRLADRLTAVTPVDEHFLPAPRTAAGRRRTLHLYLAWVGICQQTRTLEGVVEGRWYRGSDFLAHRFRSLCDEDPARFGADALAAMDAATLGAWLAPDGDAARVGDPRVAERTALLNDLGRHLLRNYSGDAANLLAGAKGRLGGPRGVLARLAATRAYRDPVRKKSFLLVLFLRGLGLYAPPDPGALGLPVDYHILRIFLRSGVLRLGGGRAPVLLAGGVMTEAEDLVLRRAAVRAGRVMTRSLPLERLDALLWMIGRNCCFYDHPPVCTTGPCALGDRCSLLASTDLDCGGRCPWDGECAGSRDPEAAARREPGLDTDYY